MQPFCPRTSNTAHIHVSEFRRCADTHKSDLSSHLHLHQLFLPLNERARLCNETCINVYISHIVHENGTTQPSPVLQNVLQEGGFAGTEKPGQHRDRQLLHSGSSPGSGPDSCSTPWLAYDIAVGVVLCDGIRPLPNSAAGACGGQAWALAVCVCPWCLARFRGLAGL